MSPVESLFKAQTHINYTNVLRLTQVFDSFKITPESNFDHLKSVQGATHDLFNKCSQIKPPSKIICITHSVLDCQFIIYV